MQRISEISSIQDGNISNVSRQVSNHKMLNRRAHINDQAKGKGSGEELGPFVCHAMS